MSVIFHWILFVMPSNDLLTAELIIHGCEKTAAAYQIGFQRIHLWVAGVSNDFGAGFA
jgi:hypothetical protein